MGPVATWFLMRFWHSRELILRLLSLSFVHRVSLSVFTLGGGQRDSNLALGFQAVENFSDANHFVLPCCPFVQSIGRDVADGMSFVWMPGEPPFYVKKGAKMFVDCDEGSKFHASRVHEHVSFFTQKFNLIPGVPAPVESPEAFPVVDAGPLFQPVVVHAPQGRSGVAVEHGAPKIVDAPVEIPDKVAEGRGIALSKEHCLTHWPISPFCDVCNRARLYSKRAHSVRQSDDGIDLPDPDAFGQQLACDHIIVLKSAKGKEHAVFITQDRFSKVIQAYPSVSRDSAQVASSFKRFVGLRGNDFTLVKSDAAGEILKAVVGQGWLSEASVPSCFPHNPHLEREIRSFQEVARSLFLQAGFAARPQLRPQACSYAATIMAAGLHLYHLPDTLRQVNTLLWKPWRDSYVR